MPKPLPSILEDFYRDASQYEQTTPERAAQLGRRIRRSKNDLAARNELVLGNLRLVVYVATKFQSQEFPMEDLVSVGMFGLIRAAEKFDPRKAKFSTYAVLWIRQFIMRHLYESGVIHLPCHIRKETKKVGRARERFYLDHGYEPSLDDLVEATGMSRSLVEAVECALTARFGMFATEYWDVENEEYFTVNDNRASEVSPSVAADQQELVDIVKRVMRRRLDKRDRDIINRRMNGETLQAIADSIGITRERVRQIEWRALRVIRSSIGKDGELLPKKDKLPVLRAKALMTAESCLT